MSSHMETTSIMEKKFALTLSNGDDVTAEISSFANLIGLERAAPGRYSILLVLGLFGGFKSNHLNPAKVVHEIEALEGIGLPSQLKPPIQFKHFPLKGLWHKHYLEDELNAMAINLQKGLKRYGLPLFDQRIKEAKKAGEERYVTIEDIPPLVNDVLHGNWMRLAKAEALTGEWIVYAQHEGKNYYLCLGTHDIKQHNDLRNQINTICRQEFPFLSALLASA